MFILASSKKNRFKPLMQRMGAAKEIAQPIPYLTRRLLLIFFLYFYIHFLVDLVSSKALSKPYVALELINL